MVKKIYPYLSITINWNYDKLFIIEHIINQLSSLTNSCENFDDKNLTEHSSKYDSWRENFRCVGN